MQNSVDIAGYSRAVQSGRFATIKGVALNEDDRLRAHVIERLMCDLAVDLDTIEGGTARFADAQEALKPLAEQGLVTLDGARVAVTDRGRPYIRIAAAAFDPYLNSGQKRHSVAV